MPHAIGERLRCDDCGAEVVYVEPCLCPDSEAKAHSHTCCGEEMQLVAPRQEPAPPEHPEAAH